ncbi:MAG: transglycosylase SLT domain-containing protein [Rikenellaceae bacterium]
MKNRVLLYVATLAIIVVAVVAPTTTYASQGGSKTSWRERRLTSKLERLRHNNKALEEKKIESNNTPSTNVNDVDTSQIANAVALPAAESATSQSAMEFDSVPYREDVTVDYTPEQMDSLLSVWRERQANEHFTKFFNDFVNINDSCTVDSKGMLSDSMYSLRLKNLMSPIHLPYNNIVRSYIARYTNTQYGTINRIMSLSQYYFPMIEQELIIRNMPVELRAMPIIESALSATAVSRAGAVGLWQFMPATGKMYGLEINSLIDERRDPDKATKAACWFMKDLYNMFDDWSLAIAAYNCGPGNVNKAMTRAGVAKGDFWDIYEYLPRETRGYVPAFIGATYAYAYHQQHNITFEESPLPLATDTIMINRVVHLGQIAETINLSMEVLRDLNPQYIKDIIPATTKEYSLRLPQKYVVQYLQNEEAIHAKDTAYLKEYIHPEAIEKARTVPDYIIHRVKSGDTLGAIARKYRVSVRQIMSWNNLRSADRISIGQRLKIQRR